MRSRATVHPLALCLLACGILLLCPAIGVAQSCAGGGALRPDEGGVGGTGIRADRPDDEGGIGGTGVLAGDTGVIGTITGFASVCVGGTEIHYDTQTPVEIDGRAATVSALAVGQVVEVVAKGHGTDVQAQEIVSRHIVVGPITRADNGNGVIDVMGQAVQLSPSTRFGERVADSATGLGLNTRVQVSGMRRSDGIVVASRVSLAAAGIPVQLSGQLSKGEESTLTVAGVPLLSDVEVAAHVGREVRVVGLWDGQAIVAQSVDVAPLMPFDGRVARVDIEGYAHSTPSGQVYLGAFLVDLPKSMAASSAALFEERGARMRVQAVVRDHRVVAERVAVAADLPASVAAERPHGHSRTDDPSDESHDGKHERPGGDHMSPPGPGDHGDHHEMFDPEGGGPPVRPDRPDRHSLDVPSQSLPERPDKPMRPEIPFIPERPPRPERPSMPDRPGAHGHHGG